MKNEGADHEVFKETLPGNSVKDVGDRIKGGAVREERSPENEAILEFCKCSDAFRDHD